MHFRRILFDAALLTRPQIYRAMHSDGIDAWTDYGTGIAEAADNGGNDFPQLRDEIQKAKGSYSFHVLETLDGSCIAGLHCRHGLVSMANRLINDQDIESLKNAVRPCEAAA